MTQSNEQEPISEAFNAMVSTMAAGLPDSAIARFDVLHTSNLCGCTETARRLLAWFVATREAIKADNGSIGRRATVRAMQRAVYRRYGRDEITRGWAAALWLHFIAAATPTREEYAQAMVVAP